MRGTCTWTAQPDGRVASSTLRLYLFHNAKELLARGSGPYFYLPKLESHLEARLWNEMSSWTAEQELGLPVRNDQSNGADRDDSGDV